MIALRGHRDVRQHGKRCCIDCVSATNAAALASTITAASIRAAASIAASIAQRSHQRHSDAISMHPSQSACVLALSEAAVAEHAALAAAVAASEPIAAKLNALVASLDAF
jgi:hypothetical protein